MISKEILNYLVDQIHTTVVATVDDKGLPVTSVIDMMLAKEEKLFFITAKGKSFYKRLMDNQYVSLSGVKGKDTMSSVSISIRGNVRDCGSDLLDEVFKKNAYMEEIYHSKASRQALTVLEIYKGQGEYFDLSNTKVERYSFSFGDYDISKKNAYEINNKCVACGDCLNVCPSNCIKEGSPFYIIQKNCLHCGNCFEVCKFSGVDKNV